MSRMPVYFVSHGGGPWPHIEGMRQQYALTEKALRALSGRLPAKPRAILMITAHWEADEFTVSTGEHPPMFYDYYGFPANTYQIQYPAPGSPELAAQVASLLSQAGLAVKADPVRGFDHGTFVPLMLMYPDADVPVVMLSLKSSLNALEHIRLGQALESLRDEGVLIVGSGLSYHNMRGFGRDESTPIATVFDQALADIVADRDTGQRNDRLVNWQSIPGARQVHPREDHLLPLMAIAGAAGNDVGRVWFVDHVAKVPMASYEFGRA
ncbi:class III extradiol ring-cleavage dioxygenase [Chitinimonas sp.]|uniref:DODA-type extradiol aromatic ring-opening family dioxygenase n=1 Tax=Chitinimonas sp. TaxID=1934313 RepID=UPI0035AE2C55